MSPMNRQRYLPAYDMLDVRAGMDFGTVSVEAVRTESHQR